MQAILYNNKSDSRYLNKNITQIHRVTIYFKDNTKQTNPIFKLSGDYSLENINYIYVEDLNKYYYVEDVEYSKQYIYLYCHVDVLMTYRENLKKLNAIIKRNEYNFNLYQNDERMKLYSFNSIRTLEFPYGFNFNSQHFIMGIAGSSSGNNQGG